MTPGNTPRIKFNASSTQASATLLGRIFGGFLKKAP
jgi:hypothetical protein